MNKRLLLLVPAFVFAGSVAAQTATGGTKPAPAKPSNLTYGPGDVAPPESAKIDRDPKRMAELVRNRFNYADSDHDGLLTRAEADKGMPMVAKHFDEIDTKHAGKVSLDDVAAYMAKRGTTKKAATVPPAPAGH